MAILDNKNRKLIGLTRSVLVDVFCIVLVVMFLMSTLYILSKIRNNMIGLDANNEYYRIESVYTTEVSGVIIDDYKIDCVGFDPKKYDLQAVQKAYIAQLPIKDLDALMLKSALGCPKNSRFNKKIFNGKSFD